MKFACLVRTMQSWRPSRTESPVKRTGRLWGLSSPDCHLGMNDSLLCREIFQIKACLSSAALLPVEPHSSTSDFCRQKRLQVVIAAKKVKNMRGIVIGEALFWCSLRAAAITTSWAFTTALISSVSYISTRTSGAINDTQQEHSIVAILSVSCTLRMWSSQVTLVRYF